ncbi:uncharacterized protein LOC113228216 [Hyposmocoma kahamanoa]|uniref:uncharacterized protein LOC113228216 n=1 Tax=Hyposmocoma kahamanoa TaxID=1477025 RepID=UPI000E6D82E6|nr:uncharacterized protein LOC113228216 [Hyposmocoma kahamanoa]
MEMCSETGSKAIYQYGDMDGTTITLTRIDKKKFNIDQRLRSIKVDCVDVSNVDPEMVLKLRIGIWPSQPHVSLAKYILCVLNKLNVMSKEGVFKVNEAYELIPYNEKDDAMIKIDQCLYPTKSLPHEKAYFYMKCINEDKPQEFNIF